MHGIICIWYGALADIPDGWVVCDGTNGTPDLINRFVRGAAAWQPPGTRVGDWGHTHEGNVDSNTDSLTTGDEIQSYAPEGHFYPTTAGHDHPYSIPQTSHIPPSTHLYWIMKL